MKLLVLASYAQSGVSAGWKVIRPQTYDLGTAGRPQWHASVIPSSLETCLRGFAFKKLRFRIKPARRFVSIFFLEKRAVCSCSLS